MMAASSLSPGAATRKRRSIRRFVAFYREGRLKLDELAARSYALDGINDALAALARGDGGRGVVVPQ